MKKAFKNLFDKNTGDLKDLRNFMFAKDYWKAVDKNSDSVKSAINNTLDIGRKSVKTTAVIAVTVGTIIGTAIGTIFE